MRRFSGEIWIVSPLDQNSEADYYQIHLDLFRMVKTLYMLRECLKGYRRLIILDACTNLICKTIEYDNRKYLVHHSIPVAIYGFLVERELEQIALEHWGNELSREFNYQAPFAHNFHILVSKLSDDQV